MHSYHISAKIYDRYPISVANRASFSKQFLNPKFPNAIFFRFSSHQLLPYLVAMNKHQPSFDKGCRPWAISIISCILFIIMTGMGGSFGIIVWVSKD